VDQDGDVLDILVQSRRDKKAAKKFFRKLLKGLPYVPRVIITDKLKSYSAAKAEAMPSVEHLQQKYQNNRAETDDENWIHLPELIILLLHEVKLTIPALLVC
jgi:putative transposase